LAKHPVTNFVYAEQSATTFQLTFITSSVLIAVVA